MNKIFMVGRLVADPEAFTTKAGDAQSRITIATQDNRVKTESYFFPCVAWRTNANFINTYLKKGDLVAIDGKLTRRSFVSREGKTLYSTEIVIDAINSLGSKRDSANATAPTASHKTQSIDQAFPEHIVDQGVTNTPAKPAPVKYEANDEVEWLGDLKE